MFYILSRNRIGPGFERLYFPGLLSSTFDVLQEKCNEERFMNSSMLCRICLEREIYVNLNLSPQLWPSSSAELKLKLRTWAAQSLPRREII